MSRLEDNDWNFGIALIIVLCSGFMLPLLTQGLNIGIAIQIAQYVAMWAFLTVIPAILFHYAPMRADYRIKKFSEYVGLSFAPFLFQNIAKPLLEINLASNLDGVWDPELIRQATSSWVFQFSVFLYSALPVITLCLVIVFFGLSINKVYNIATEKALLISIPLVLTASLMTWLVQMGLLAIFP